MDEIARESQGTNRQVHLRRIVVDDVDGDHAAGSTVVPVVGRLGDGAIAVGRDIAP